MASSKFKAGRARLSSSGAVFEVPEKRRRGAGVVEDRVAVFDVEVFEIFH